MNGNIVVRDKKIDFIKGVGIILVVLSHTKGCPFGSLYASWFSQLFFILAGYTFNHAYSENIGGGI